MVRPRWAFPWGPGAAVPGAWFHVREPSNVPLRWLHVCDNKGRRADISLQRRVWRHSPAPASSEVRILGPRQWGIAGPGGDRPSAVIETGTRKLRASDVRSEPSTGPGLRHTPGLGVGQSAAWAQEAAVRLVTLPSGSTVACAWKLDELRERTAAYSAWRPRLVNTTRCCFAPSGLTGTEAGGRASRPGLSFHLSASVSNVPFAPRRPQRARPRESPVPCWPRRNRNPRAVPRTSPPASQDPRTRKRNSGL